MTFAPEASGDCPPENVPISRAKGKGDTLSGIRPCSYTEEQPGPLTTLRPPVLGVTCICVPMRSFKAATCEITPMSLPSRCSPGQRIQRGVQRILIQRAEPFVEEKGVHPHRLAGHLRKPEGEGKAHDETFAAGKVLGGADFSGLIAVDDVELQRLLLVAEKQIPVGHAP